MDILCNSFSEMKCKIKSETVTETKAQALPDEEKIIVCAACSYPVTDPSKQIQINDLFSHVFANPYGHVYEIGCFSRASGCISGSPSSTEFSWFMGYEWQIGICRQCSGHLGWIFTAVSDQFYGLILDKLIFPARD